MAILKLSRLDVVASQAPRRSGCSIRSRFSTRRNQVVWHTSATSASFRRQRLAMEATNPPKRLMRFSQAAPAPARACATTRVRSPSSRITPAVSSTVPSAPLTHCSTDTTKTLPTPPRATRQFASRPCHRHVPQLFGICHPLF